MAYVPLDNEMPDWRSRMIMLKNREQNTAKRYREQFRFGEDEKGMKNPNNKSHIKIFDNGNIELYAGDASGITINDQYDTVSMYGHGINMNSQYINMATVQQGLRWNGYYLNPQLYLLADAYPKVDRYTKQDLYLTGSVKRWVKDKDYAAGGYWAWSDIRIKPFVPLPADDKYGDILKELGIPT